MRHPGAVRIGLHLPRLTYPGGPATLGADLAAIVTAAEAAGVDYLLHKPLDIERFRRILQPLH